MWRYNLVLAAASVISLPAAAATWADSMFGELKKDFGPVRQGQVQVHEFRVRNNTKGDVRISSLAVSCGCVTARVPNSYLRPGEETVVHASMDTGRFHGPRTVTIFVRFSEPAYDEVRLWVSANARSDFHVSPESLAVGQVKRGAGGTASVTVTFYGNRDARITRIHAESNYIQPAAVETRRLDHEVSYTVNAKVRADTPAGKWYTDVWLETNVFGLTQLRLPLTVEIESALTVNPPQVVLGEVAVGGEAERRVIIRGVKPFKITSIKGADGDVVAEFKKEAREVHVVTVKVKPGKAGKISRTLKAVTDLKEDNVIDFNIEADAKK
jgi:hypothetical protein